MSVSQQIQEVELTIEEAKHEVEFGEAIDRLTKNPDYKKVILEGYMRDEALRLVKLTGDPNLPPERMADVQAGIRAVGELNYFLHFGLQRAEHMRQQIAEHNATLDELREEEAGE